MRLGLLASVIAGTAVVRISAAPAGPAPDPDPVLVLVQHRRVRVA
ncbi:hypothetical protein [Streptomyces sp. NPDC058382]